MTDPIIIVDYDAAWPALFATLRASVAEALGDVAVAIDHVGSTAVPGLAAKPIIDLDVAIRAPADLPVVIDRLAPLGYDYEGERGVAGRAAFTWPRHLPCHHLYVCALASAEYRRHLLFRDFLRVDPGAAAAYATLKHRLAAQYRTERDAYADAKTSFIWATLVRAEEWARQTGWTALHRAG
jgi:GrpB-like predicted nucleotidyltransferase (UPF0157 family)